MRVPPELVLPIEDNFYKRTYDGLMTVLMSTSKSMMSLLSPSIFQKIFNGLPSLTFWTYFPAVLRRFPELTISTVIVTDEKSGGLGRRTNLIEVVINHLSRQDEG
jgi:hypothetical protein